MSNVNIETSIPANKYNQPHEKTLHNVDNEYIIA